MWRSGGGPVGSICRRCQLGRLGYQDLQAVRHMGLLAHLSEWMGRREVVPAELGAESIAEFFLERRRSGHRWLVTPRAARPLLAYLRQAKVVPMGSPVPRSARSMISWIATEGSCWTS